MFATNCDGGGNSSNNTQTPSLAVNNDAVIEEGWSVPLSRNDDDVCGTPEKSRQKKMQKISDGARGGTGRGGGSSSSSSSSLSEEDDDDEDDDNGGGGGGGAYSAAPAVFRERLHDSLKDEEEGSEYKESSGGKKRGTGNDTNAAKGKERKWKKRCEKPGCAKGAQGSTSRCVAHG
eukprot:CAMPEP_0171644316 /NCGR_PEP_ID=MMETSP0990-20121206/33298_1 /TAXON_ID=483369 /ORGANISM="non described non described, Strain CCMP2098" /LENGTH=175 /DNA_ID=CAMNT_0012220345 /DNA_START=297 /DNA_END=820 /DNA_ORIENTATION=-